MTIRPLRLRGPVHVLRDAAGRAIDHIDTDMIFHNAHLGLTDIAEMGRHALGNLPGLRNLHARVRAGDILVAGRNFGAGSSRQQAVDCFRALGVALIVAESFGAVYRRNAINAGLPVLCCPGIASCDAAGRPWVASGDLLKVDLATGGIRNETTDRDIPGGRPLSEVEREIYRAGDLFAFARARGMG